MSEESADRNPHEPHRLSEEDERWVAAVSQVRPVMARDPVAIAFDAGVEVGKGLTRGTATTSTAFSWWFPIALSTASAAAAVLVTALVLTSPPSPVRVDSASVTAVPKSVESGRQVVASIAAADPGDASARAQGDGLAAEPGRGPEDPLGRDAPEGMLSVRDRFLLEDATADGLAGTRPDGSLRPASLPAQVPSTIGTLQRLWLGDSG